jgi:hypothetical protein
MLELSELIAPDEFAQRARHPKFPNASPAWAFQLDI